jgi:TPR repeat protein
MQTQYPAQEDSGKRFESVTNWLEKISNEGYTEVEVEEVMNYIDKIKSSSKEEAAKLLLISASTESKYAQFRLARSLFKGDILQKNSDEAYTLINRLAVNEDYPEAICDLAQFYEHGIGIAKDKYKAEALYKEAMDAGIKRATEHFTRLKKQNKSFLSFLTK